MYTQFREVYAYNPRHARPYDRDVESDISFREEVNKIRRDYILSKYYEMQAPINPVVLCGITYGP